MWSAPLIRGSSWATFTQAGRYSRVCNRWGSLGSPSLWRMKNQKRPYWTQIQRESPLLFSPLLSPFPPSLGNSHECGKLSSRWTPLRARGTPDALLGRCLPPLLEMPCLPICKSHASSQGRKGKLRDWGEGEPKPNKQKTIFPQPPLPASWSTPNWTTFVAAVQLFRVRYQGVDSGGECLRASLRELVKY